MSPKTSSLPRLAALLALPALLQTAATADVVVVDSSRDNTLYESLTGALSYGAGENMFAGRVGQMGGYGIRRALVYFDVASQVPAGSTIQHVTLQLFMSLSPALTPNAVALHRALADWGEGTSSVSGGSGGGGAGAPSTSGDATWIHTYYSSSFWANVGGDFDPAPSAVETFGLSFFTYYTWNSPGMAADVQAWLDAPASNHGWVLLGDESTGGTARRFDTRESSNASRRPKLTIVYTPPGGGPGAASCFGTGCPCGNDDPSAGCANSTGGGALLAGSGSTSVAADDLVLTATGLPPSNQGLFYMGSAVVHNAFFDGFQCALGTSFRFLGSIQSSGGSGTMTYTGWVADSGALIAPGTTWHFHCWHRDVPGTPCGTGANLTSLYSVTFTP